MFKKKSKSKKVDFFEKQPGEVRYYFHKSKTYVRLDEFFIRIYRVKSIRTWNAYTVSTEKTIALNSINGFQLKEPGSTVGYLQLIYPGSQEVKRGFGSAIYDENTIAFVDEDAIKIKSIIIALEEAMAKRVNNN